MPFASVFFTTLFAATAFASPLKTRQSDSVQNLPRLLVPLVEDQPDTNFGTLFTGNISAQGGQHQISMLTSFDIEITRPICALSFVASGIEENYQFTGTQRFEVWDMPPFNYKEVTWNTHDQPTKYNGIININPQGESNSLVFPCRYPYNELMVKSVDGDDVYIDWFELAHPILGLLLTQSYE
ncbi:hypothetical protein NEOLI_003548 [Neolecta irregularis DAH-3]|uniref:Ubiquitin 3 binding protein But2 C-terminal domain-containing protein n=1 Tax=Neolecta irregularis (strain DAH-3) TaxID=1198029 RepID=A0A1U7LNK0_NEOID|nr:hypothetical protein NEOLI_003548 [Neolecta irregularis DAH-3]|eukprot:OLL24227.1 hypothetical protein NEOLI_003548 [Neolecta irregularis DAH-3]